MLTTMFGVLVFVAFATAWTTRDWRLKTVATAYACIWLTTVCLREASITSLPWVNSAYTAFIFLLAFSIQARGEVERARGEPLAMWLLVPIGVEAVLGLSYFTEGFLSDTNYWRLTQAGFTIELICLLTVGGRRLDLVGRVRRGANAIASLIRTTPRPA